MWNRTPKQMDNNRRTKWNEHIGRMEGNILVRNARLYTKWVGENWEDQEWSERIPPSRKTERMQQPIKLNAGKKKR
jgi:hypothetical protein